MRTPVLGLTLVFVGLASCAHREPTVVTTTTAATTPNAVPFLIPNNTAIYGMMNERCQREMACNAVGPGKRFDSFGACTRDAERNARATIGEGVCPNGVIDAQLASCLTDIRNEPCASALDVATIPACRAANVCR
jgi:hypothetical protein